MDRRAVLLKGITKDMLGIEIGPYHRPLVPKREGYRSLSLDVFDTETLRRNAAADSAITKKKPRRSRRSTSSDRRRDWPSLPKRGDSSDNATISFHLIISSIFPIRSVSSKAARRR